MAENRSYTPWWIAGAIAFLCLPMLLYLRVGGMVRGEEFSPDDFSRRAFSYNVMPIFKINLRGVEYRDMTPVFEQTLLADGLIGTPDSIKRWHLIYDSASDTRSRDFDARLLCRFLDLHDKEFESIWIAWNEDHSELAAVFWPIIADLARNCLYIDISEIMLKATGVTAENADAFRSYLEQSASAAFRVRADEFQREKQYEDAVALYSKSIDILPSSAALAGRAGCYRALGKSELSEQDLQATRNLNDP